MSYCVHCGVELEKTIKVCPLCNTPVTNPKQLPDPEDMAPFSSRKGSVTPVRRSDIAILISVVLLSSSISCGLLNFLVFRFSFWSIYVIGICAVLWVIFTPAIIYSKLPIYISIALDGVAAALYVGMIAYRYPGEGWYFHIALPIILMVTLLILIYIFLSRKYTLSILSRFVVVFSEIALLCLGIEIVITRYLMKKINLTWSAVVLTSCGIIVIALITIIKRTRLREEVRRRMHL